MSNYRPIDSKREEFRKYLEQGGVMDALTKVLVSLYEESEKPTDPLDYVKKNLGGGVDGGDDVQGQLEEKNNKIAALETQVKTLNDKLEKYDPATPELTPEVPPADTPPDTAADGAPDAGLDEATPEVTSEATPEATPDVPEVAPDVPDDAAAGEAEASPEDATAEA